MLLIQVFFVFGEDVPCIYNIATISLGSDYMRQATSCVSMCAVIHCVLLSAVTVGISLGKSYSQPLRIVKIIYRSLFHHLLTARCL